MGLFKKSKESLYNKGIEFYKKKDYAKAYAHFVEAAEMGLNEAAYMLGLFSERGYAVEEDLEDAIYWYEKASAAGIRDAKDSFERVMLLYYGKAGVGAMKTGQYELARSCFEKVLDYGNTAVVYNYAQLLEAGVGGEKDFKRALELYRKLADAGLNEALEKVKTLSAEIEAEKKAETEKRTAAEQREKEAIRTGDAELLINAATARIYGKGIEADTRKAKELLGRMKPENLSEYEENCYYDLLRVIRNIEEKR